MLAHLICLGILERFFGGNILLENKGKHTRPRCPEGIVKHREPVEEVDLSTISVKQGEPNLREHHYYVLIKVV